MCQKIPSFLWKALAISFANFLTHNKPMNTHTMMSFPTFSLEYVFHQLWLLFFPLLTFIKWYFHQGSYRTPPPLWDTILGVQPHLYVGKTTETQTYFPWSFEHSSMQYLQWSPTEKKTNMTTINDISPILLIGAL